MPKVSLTFSFLVGGRVTMLSPEVHSLLEALRVAKVDFIPFLFLFLCKATLNQEWKYLSCVSRLNFFLKYFQHVKF